MSWGAKRRFKRVGWWASLVLVLVNAGAYWAAWAACRLGARPPRNALRRLGFDQRFTRRTPAQSGLAYERHVFPSRDRTFLEGWVIPHAEPRAVVVMFHGYGATKGDLLREARAFHELALDVLLVDFRGSGGSEGNETSIGFHEAQDVQAAGKIRRIDLGRNCDSSRKCPSGRRTSSPRRL